MALLVLSISRPGGVTLGRAGVAVDYGQLEFAWATQPLAARGRAWQIGQAGMIMVGPQSHWRPSVSNAAMSVARGPVTTTDTLDTLWVPLWQLAFVLGGLALVAWRLGRRFGPGACAACGYDLQGLASDRCPECGAGIAAAGGGG